MENMGVRAQELHALVATGCAVRVLPIACTVAVQPEHVVLHHGAGDQMIQLLLIAGSNSETNVTSIHCLLVMNGRRTPLPTRLSRRVPAVARPLGIPQAELT